MNATHAATAFLVIFPAELPDKTFIASLLLGTRGRPLHVWLGVVSAFAVHVAIAVTVGGLFAMLPHRFVEAVVAVLFFGGSAWCLLIDESEQETKGARSVEQARTRRRTILGAFGIIFLAEWGDLTQILTAQLAAHSRDPLGVAVGAIAALMVVAGLAVVGSRGLLRIIPLRVVRRLTGGLLAVLGVLSVVTAAR